MSWRTSSKHLVVIFTPQCHEMSARQCCWFPFLQMWQLMWTPVQNCLLLEKLSIYLRWVWTQVLWLQRCCLTTHGSFSLSVRFYYEVQYGRSGPRASISRHCCVSVRSVEHSCLLTVRLGRSLFHCSFLQWHWLLFLRNLLKSPQRECAHRLGFIHRYLCFSLRTSGTV